MSRTERQFTPDQIGSPTWGDASRPAGFRMLLAAMVAAAAIGGAAASGLGLTSASAAMAAGVTNVSNSAWSLVPSPNLTYEDNLNSVACVSPDDCWAVGGADTGLVGQTLIEHDTGDGWGVVSSPDTSSTVPNDLNGIACVSATDCWAVGEDYFGTLIEQFNGTTWSIVTSPNASSFPNDLNGIACVNASDCLAVGRFINSGAGNPQLLIESYNGAAWSISGTGTSAYAASSLDGVTCVSASDCWAVGAYSNGTTEQTLVLQWSGSAWSQVASADFGGSGTFNELAAVTCVGAGDCWAVGTSYQYSIAPLIEQWNGTDWALSSTPGGAGSLLGVGCVSADSCWAAGTNFSDTLIEQWDGSAWATVSSPNAGQYDELAGITCDGAVNCWAVGIADDQDGTLIEQYTEPTAPAMVTALTPAAGPVGGGQTVTVSGYDFASGMTVTLGGASVTISDVTPTSFSFTTPAHAAGAVTLVATDTNGSSLSDGNAGYLYAGLASYVPVTPFRVLDTRSGTCVQCGTGALLPGGTMTLQVTGYTVGSESVPSGATSVVLNVTAVPGSGSYLTIFPAGTGRPISSNLNFNAQTNTANLVVVALGTGGEVNLYNSLGAVDVVADVEGYFTAPSGTQGQFHPIAPLRVCDTRVSQPSNPCNSEGTEDLALGAGQVAKVDVAAVTSAQGDIPSDGSAEAAVLNLTAVSGTQATYLSVYPTSSNGTCSTAVPQSSTLNVSAQTNQANRVIVPLGPATSGSPETTDVCVYNSLGTINFILDADGWFGTSSAAAGTQFQVIGPSRICDTRAGTGTECTGDTLTPGDVLPVQVTGVGGVPASGPVAVVANVTAVSGSSDTYLTVYPAGGTTPNASDLNVDAQQNLPNLAITELGSSGAGTGAVGVYNSLGTIDIVMDVEGWFQ